MEITNIIDYVKIKAIKAGGAPRDKRAAGEVQDSVEKRNKRGKEQDDDDDMGANSQWLKSVFVRNS